LLWQSSFSDDSTEARLITIWNLDFLVLISNGFWIPDHSPLHTFLWSEYQTSLVFRWWLHT
jgi:hypothetical protein